MKFSRLSLFFAALAGILLGSSPCMAAPTFGGTQLIVPVGGVNYTYTFYTSNSASPQRTDGYRTLSPIYLLTVTGMVATPTLANVTGSRGSVQINGYLQNGTYHDKVQTSTSSIALTVNGRNYNFVTTTVTNTVSLSAGTVTSSATQVYTGDGTFTVNSNGTVSGAEAGYYVDGTLYLNNSISSSANLTAPSGRTYTTYTYKTIYSLNGGQVIPNVVEIYSNAGGDSFTVDSSGNFYGSETGCVVNGSWYFNRTDDIAIDFTSPEGRHYTLDSVYTAYHGSGGQVVVSKRETVMGGVGSFIVDFSGNISGSETGFAVNSVWYLNYSHDSSAVDYTSPEGRHYTQKKFVMSYSSDGNGGVTSGDIQIYSGASVSFNIDPQGKITGSETGYLVNGALDVNSNYSPTTPTSELGSFTLFGNAYNFIGGNKYSYFASNGSYTSNGWSDNYSATGGGTAQIIYSNDRPNPVINGWDPYAGTFSADYVGGFSNLVWQPRTAPSFAATALWINGLLVNWQSGAIDASSGMVVDTYGPDGSGHVLTISGSPSYTSIGQVGIDGANVGCFAYPGSFTVTGWDVEAGAPNKDTPFFCPSTLWVDGTPYAFSYGYDDGTRCTDMYVTSGGTLRLSSERWNTTSVTVQLNHNGEIHTGLVNTSTSFTVAGVDITAVPPETGPPAFWVDGIFYRRTAGTNQYVSFPTAGNTLSLGGANTSFMQLSGMQDGNTLTGVFNPTVGLFTISRQDGTLMTACTAQNDGRQIPGSVAPDDCPPAVRIRGEVWCYIGEMRDDGAPAGTTAASYGNTRISIYSDDPATEADYHRQLLKIRLDGSGTVTLTDYRDGTSTSGSYNKYSHLFQTGTTASLPMPVLGVDPNNNDALWQIPQAPQPGSGGSWTAPASLLVGGDVWRWIGMDGGDSELYQGYYEGQQLTLSSPNPGGARSVTVVDPVNGNTTGMLRDLSGSTILNNGLSVNTGTMSGTPVQPSNLQSVAGDLGLPGNIITIGTLLSDPSTPGATLQFSETWNQAMFDTALNRSAAQWRWWRMAPGTGQNFVLTMVVDSAFGLVLYDPADPILASVQLNPSSGGVSKLPKLKLGNQTLDEDGSVLTRALGDSRYLQIPMGTQGLVLSGGFNVNTANGLNTAPADAVTIGHNLQAVSGQVVVGQNSAADNDQIFIIGAGVSTSETKNALSVSTSGNTTMNGNLTVSGNADVSGTLSVNGALVPTQTAADARYYQQGLPIRVAPAGDIDMGEFKTIPANVTVPGLPPP